MVAMLEPELCEKGATLETVLATPEGKQQAVNNCLECHDLDNSPKLDFDEYWPSVEHSEKKSAAAGK